MERQGEMCNLEAKSKAELIEFAARLEKLLTNKSLLNRLPEKGEKVKLLAKKVQQLIARHDALVDDIKDLFEKMDIGVPQNVSPATTNAFLKTDCKPTQVKADSFKPYRTLHSECIPQGLQKPLSPMLKEAADTRRYKHRLPEMSAVSVPAPRHSGTQEIDLKEAAELLQKQRSKVEALQAQQAAERLAERMHIQMGDDRPENQDRYRNPDVQDSDISDGSASEDDGESDARCYKTPE